MSVQNQFIRFDWAAKRLLRQKANFVILEGFLTVLLNEQITIDEILESESNQLAYDDKFNRVDLKARNSKGEIIIVEIQNTRELYYLERILYGVSKAVTEHISSGDNYDKVKKVYSISILYFDIGKGSDYLYHGKTDFIGVNTHDKLEVKRKDKEAILPANPADIFPEYYLIRVNEFNKHAVTPLEEWIEFLKTDSIPENSKAPGLEAAREILNYHAMNKVEKQVYDQHINAVRIQNDVISTAHIEGKLEGRLEGKLEGKLEGMKESEKKRNLEIAKKMLALHLPTAQIIEVTGLTESEINA